MVVMNTVRSIMYPLLFIQRVLNEVLLIRTGFISSVPALILKFPGILDPQGIAPIYKS